MADLWDELAGKPPVEGGGEFEPIPANVWVLGRTVADPQNGWAPGVQEGEVKQGENKGNKFFKFRLGLQIEGGALDPKFGGFYVGYDAFVHPSPKDDGGNILSGKLTGMLNALFATGVAAKVDDKKQRAGERWNATLKVLKAAASAHGITPDQYTLPKKNPDDPNERAVPDVALFLTGCAVMALLDESRTVLVKTKLDEYEGKSGKVSKVIAGAVEDDTDENRSKRAVVPFDAEPVAF